MIVGHGATARELSAVASLFDEVRHVACLHEGPPPASARPYDAANVTLVPVPPAGGPTLRDKLAIARLTPRYVRTIRRELRDAIVEGALLRLRPKLMTVITVIVGLLPIMWGTGTGSEVMRRIAAPMVGGMVSATVLTLVIIPSLYLIVNGRKLRPA